MVLLLGCFAMYWISSFVYLYRYINIYIYTLISPIVTDIRFTYGVYSSYLYPFLSSSPAFQARLSKQIPNYHPNLINLSETLCIIKSLVILSFNFSSSLPLSIYLAISVHPSIHLSIHPSSIPYHPLMLSVSTFHFFQLAFFWVTSFISAVFQMTVAGGIASWYFSRDAKGPVGKNISTIYNDNLLQYSK